MLIVISLYDEITLKRVLRSLWVATIGGAITHCRGHSSNTTHGRLGLPGHMYGKDQAREFELNGEVESQAPQGTKGVESSLELLVLLTPSYPPGSEFLSPKRDDNGRGTEFHTVSAGE